QIELFVRNVRSGVGVSRRFARLLHRAGGDEERQHNYRYAHLAALSFETSNAPGMAISDPRQRLNTFLHPSKGCVVAAPRTNKLVSGRRQKIELFLKVVGSVLESLVGGFHSFIR